MLIEVRLQGFYNHYYPIEHDSRMSDKEKLPHMVKWWESAHALVVSFFGGFFGNTGLRRFFT